MLSAEEIIEKHVYARCGELVENLQSQGYEFQEWTEDEMQVMEWWLVSDWFAWKLKSGDYENGLAYEYLGLHFWGRFSTGISLELDGYIKDMMN